MIPILIIVASIATVLFPIGLITIGALHEKGGDDLTITIVFLATIMLTITSLSCWVLALWFGIHELIHPHQSEVSREVITIPSLD